MKILIAEKKKDLYNHLFPICSAMGVEIMTCSTEQDLILLTNQIMPLVIVLESDYAKDNQTLLNSLFGTLKISETPMLFVCRDELDKKKILT